jgi:hypothetical protein
LLGVAAEALVREGASAVIAAELDEAGAGDRPDWRTAALGFPDEAGDGLVWSPYPPFDIAAPDRLPDLPDVAGATVACQYSLERSPLGDVACLHVFRDGRLEVVETTWHEEADVFVELPYHAYLQMRAGRMTMYEAISLGGLHGHLGRLAVLAGILESADWQLLWSSRQAVAAVLADLMPAEGPPGPR